LLFFLSFRVVVVTLLLFFLFLKADDPPPPFTWRIFIFSTLPLFDRLNQSDKPLLRTKPHTHTLWNSSLKKKMANRMLFWKKFEFFSLGAKQIKSRRDILKKMFFARIAHERTFLKCSLFFFVAKELKKKKVRV
jgi:hypothetical protein